MMLIGQKNVKISSETIKYFSTKEDLKKRGINLFLSVCYNRQMAPSFLQTSYIMMRLVVQVIQYHAMPAVGK